MPGAGVVWQARLGVDCLLRLKECSDKAVTKGEGDQKEVKKERQGFKQTQKLLGVQSRRCHCTGYKSRAQITSTSITIIHHTSTGYIGILSRMVMSALSSAPRSVIYNNETGRRWSGGERQAASGPKFWS
ncbi:hypothetical protein J6590_052734 [Homalodisca vitripennis]|nr:hypothetical protein J6590_052734 [Homalodisca vitripennis]